MKTIEKERFEKKIADDKKLIEELNEQITGLRQLLDCAAANIALLAAEKGGKCSLSCEKVREVLGRYRLTASRDENGNYILETKEIEIKENA